MSNSKTIKALPIFVYSMIVCALIIIIIVIFLLRRANKLRKQQRESAVNGRLTPLSVESINLELE